MLPVSPAPADNEHPPGSSEEENDSDEKGGGSRSSASDEFTTLDVDDNHAEVMSPCPSKPLPVHPGKLSTYRTHGGTRETADNAAVGYQVAQGDYHAAVLSAHPPPLRQQSVSRPGRQHAHSVKIPLAQYSVDGSSRE